jgi:uncharacterized membrane protein HdeD (DUF308 family)
MAISSGTRRRYAAATALRGVLLLLVGVYAIFFPSATLAALVLVGGALFLIDGVLGLWSLTFGGAKSGNYWFDVIRNVLSILSGVIILAFPFLSTLIWVWFIVYLVAFQAIVVGVMEIVTVMRERDLYARIWPVILNGALYVLFGIALLFAPMVAAEVLVVIGGILALLFAFGLFALAWRMYQSSQANGS